QIIHVDGAIGGRDERAIGLDPPGTRDLAVPTIPGGISHFEAPAFIEMVQGQGVVIRLETFLRREVLVVARRLRDAHLIQHSAKTEAAELEFYRRIVRGIFRLHGQILDALTVHEEPYRRSRMNGREMGTPVFQGGIASKVSRASQSELPGWDGDKTRW